MASAAQGDLFTGRFTARPTPEEMRRRDRSGGAMPLAERIAHQEEVVRGLTESCERIHAAPPRSSDDPRARPTFRRAVANATAHLEKLRAELAGGAS